LKFFPFDLKLHNLTSRVGSSNTAYLAFNNETKSYEIVSHKNGNSSPLSSSLVWSDGNVPKGFEKYFPGGKKSSSNESSQENKNPFDFTNKSDSNRGAGGSGGGASSSNPDDK
jgi:hypothetical protein